MINKIAVITGGAGDIGRSISFKLATNHVKVVIIDINELNIEYTIKKSKELNLNIQAFKEDITNYSAICNRLKEIANNTGAPSILINAAGITKDASITKLDITDFQDVINTNLTGIFNCIKAITPYLKDLNYGKIVNITSINALRGKHGQSAYSASKAGIIGLTKTAAIELGKYNVNVNAVAPGMIKTTMIANLPEKIIQTAINESLLGTIGKPEDVAELVYFLISDNSKHITGEVIKIDGGQHL